MRPTSRSLPLSCSSPGCISPASFCCSVENSMPSCAARPNAPSRAPSTLQPAANRSQHSISRALIRPRIILHWQLVLCALLLLAGFAGTITHGELTEEEKKQLFLKARENMRTVPTPTPEASATERRKPKPAQHPPKKKSKPKPTPEPEQETPSRTPRPKSEEPPARTSRPKEEETPERQATSESTPPRAATVTPVPQNTETPSGPNEPAQIVVKKSGYQ